MKFKEKNLYKILVCDDERLFVESTVEKVQSKFESRNQSCNIDSILSGKELLEKGDILKYDVIFLDCNLRTISGMNVAVEIRKRDIRVL